MQLQPGLPPVLADATQVEQAVLNLCTNAVHAIQGQGSERGSILVEAALVHPDQRLSERLGLAPGDYVALTVHDSGPAWTRRPWNASSSPFSPPSLWARARAWAWPWCMGDAHPRRRH